MSVYLVAALLKYLNCAHKCVMISFFFQTKKGVKRKADTTTPGGLSINSVDEDPYDPNFDLAAPPQHPRLGQGRLSAGGRRESTRQIKKPRKDLPEDQAQHSTKSKKGKLPAVLKYCNSILKELFAKKHAVSPPSVSIDPVFNDQVIECYWHWISIL